MGISITENRDLRLVVNGKYYLLDSGVPSALYAWVKLNAEFSACTILRETKGEVTDHSEKQF